MIRKIKQRKLRLTHLFAKYKPRTIYGTIFQMMLFYIIFSIISQFFPQNQFEYTEY